ncbi:hypothetical protein EVAR_30309_1 [Eumeta japonica]|uniref:Uncharacterized protein n=1 Tax=Eumeta variegata TaxID=151549 RepID=A0A4C1WBS7_EUMVA|nr:hypothetical protein EVAR_30309_1 [Eumeta japonica]
MEEGVKSGWRAITKIHGPVCAGRVRLKWAKDPLKPDMDYVDSDESLTPSLAATTRHAGALTPPNALQNLSDCLYKMS